MRGSHGSMGEFENEAIRGLNARTATYVRKTPMRSPKYTDVITVRSFLRMKESIKIAISGMPIIDSKTIHGTQSGADLIGGEFKIRTAMPRDTMQNSERSIISGIGYISI